MTLPLLRTGIIEIPGHVFRKTRATFFFALARELFSSRTKTKIFSSHVFRNA
ncbi:DUF1661 domain-containing protein [Porphyromonas gingivalis]|uniref:DUF1661 domain-containing protein n=1 Tax=Porphyromonas gingivalis TaxID=837 RepID=UPI0015C3CB3E